MTMELESVKRDRKIFLLTLENWKKTNQETQVELA